jgi:gas vesicle protein
MFARQRRRQAIKRTAAAGTIAAVAGYLAGILTAPKSGQETRQDIKTAADRSRAEAEKDFKKVQAELDNAITDAKSGSSKLGKKAQEELGELLDKAKDTKTKGGEVLAAIKAGEAEDKDLQRAVRNANTALKSLRKYLKK